MNLIRLFPACLAMLAALPAFSAPLFPVSEDYRTGFIDKTGRIALSGYEDAGDFSEGLAPVRLGGWWGFIGSSGKVEIPPRYAQAGVFSSGRARVRAGSAWGYIDKTGTLIVAPRYLEASDFREGCAAVRAADRFGLIDAQGAAVFAPKFERLSAPSEGRAAFRQDGKWGFIDKAGAVVVAAQFDAAGDFSGGLAPAKKGAKFGFIDAAGRWVVEPKYDGALAFSEGWAAVMNAKRDVIKDQSGRVVKMTTFPKWGFIDRTGAEVVPLELTHAGPFAQGLAPVWRDGRFGYIDKTGRMLLEPLVSARVGDSIGDRAGGFHAGLARVAIGLRRGAVDASGKVVVPVKFDRLGAFNGGLAPARLQDGGLWGYVDATGNFAIAPQFDEATDFYEGFARVHKTEWTVQNKLGSVVGLWALIDPKGEVSLKPAYESIAWYTDRTIAAQLDGKYGFFDRSGRVKLEPRFDSVLPLGKDRALAEQDGKCGVVDRDGALTAALSVGACGTRRAEESPQAGRGTRVPVKSGGRWGYADETGRLVIPAAFDLAGRFVDGLAPVNDGGREAWIDASGKRVWTARPDPLAAERREAAAGRRSRAESGEAHTRTIRVLVAADQLVRRKPDWAEAAGKRLGAVSEVFEKNFKIRLELARVVPWETPALDDHDDPDDYMPALVGLLRREVPLLDADMVIGYTGQGVRVPGRDLGMAGAFDPKVLVYDTGLEPKTAAVTVHELLHAFGMFHVADERSFMHAAQPPGVDASWGLDRWSVDSYTARLMSLTRGIDFTKGPDALTPKTIKELAALDAEGGGIAGNRIGRVSSPAAWAYESRGHHLLASGEIVAGLRDFNKAIELDAAAPDFYTFEDLGIGLLRVGKNKEGFGALRRCVELKPDCAHCRYSLAHWLEAKAAEAEAFERSLPPPGPWEIAELYGRPDRAEALEHYRRASGLEPRNALYHARLGEALLKRGATAEAVAELRRAAELKPDNGFYAVALENAQRRLASENAAKGP